ncbi:prolipoprotein diacylglyceryl transferase [bacterium]|nr:MAG: prolipoprotein diacylglyceryl transferase [bacterium]
MHPVLFKIGSFEVPSFGAMMVLAFFGGLWLARKRAPAYGLTPEKMSDGAFWALIAGIFGARAFFIVQEYQYYFADWRRIMTLRFEGLTSFGGLICGGLALAFWARKHKLSVLPFLELAAPGFLLAHLIGRFGCLLNGCCFGGVCPTGTPWGIRIPGHAELHHPAQVYDSLMNLVALGAVLAFARRPHRLGQVTGLTLLLHGITRFIYEFWRAGTEAQVAAGNASSTYWGTLPVTQGQVMALAISVVGLAMFALAKGRTVTEKNLPSTGPSEVAPA